MLNSIELNANDSLIGSPSSLGLAFTDASSVGTAIACACKNLEVKMI